MQHAGSSLEWQPASHSKDGLMGTKQKKVNFEVITCWMPFLTCSCWGHSAHMVKVDEIFKVTEIYKVTLAGHSGWFFFFLLVYRNSWEGDLTIYWLQKGNAVMLHQDLLKTEPQLSAPGWTIDGEGEENQEQISIAYFKLWYRCPSSIHTFPPASKEKEAYVKMLLSFLAAACLCMWVAFAVGRGTPYGPQTTFFSVRTFNSIIFWMENSLRKITGFFFFFSQRKAWTGRDWFTKSWPSTIPFRFLAHISWHQVCGFNYSWRKWP